MAGGYYTDGGGSERGFVASERHGVWGQAIEVPGLAALSLENAAVDSVSCASAGSCAAGGDDSPYGLGFVAVEKNGDLGPGDRGAWPGGPEHGRGRPGRRRGRAGVRAARRATARPPGYYSDSSGNYQGFVAVERDGRRGKAIEAPGPGALNTGGGVYVSEVSCAPAGGCAAGAFYTDRRGHSQGFAVNQTEIRRPRGWYPPAGGTRPGP